MPVRSKTNQTASCIKTRVKNEISATKLSIKEALESHSLLFQSDSSRLDCHLLLCYVLDKPRSWLLAHDDDLLTPTEIAVFSSSMKLRKEGVPMAYILGEQEFWSLTFKVDQFTLIPRAETELLVETILDRFPLNGLPVRVIDLGTGAGPIAISLASERENFEIIATDRTFGALTMAKNNSQLLLPNETSKNSSEKRSEKTWPRINFVQSNWLDSFEDSYFDLIVSNPPYVEAEDKHLESLKHEPYSALVADENGLGDFRKIISSAGQKLRKGGMIILEHGYNQQLAVEGVLKENGFSGIEKLKDLSGVDRAILAYQTVDAHDRMRAAKVLALD